MHGLQPTLLFPALPGVFANIGKIICTLAVWAIVVKFLMKISFNGTIFITVLKLEIKDTLWSVCETFSGTSYIKGVKQVKELVI